MKQKRPAGRPGQVGNQKQRIVSQHEERRFSKAGQEPAQFSQPHAPQNKKSIERLMRIERRKARSRAVALSIFVLAIMLVTVLMIIAVMQQAKPQPRFVFIQEGEIAHKAQSTGLIIRDETIFNAPAAGLLKPLVTEGSRVASGQKLALIIPADKEEELKALQKCERDIVDLQTELMNNGKGAGAEAIFNESGASLLAIVNLVRADVVKGSLTNLSAYAASLDVILEQRTARLMKIDFKDARLDTLIQTQKSLEKALGLAAGTVVCQKPGIASFKLDGLETVLNQQMAKTIKQDEFEHDVSHAAAASTEDQSVKQNQPVLRISASLDQSLVFLLPDTDAALFVSGSFTSIDIPIDGVTIGNCQVTHSEMAGSAALVVFRTDRKVEWLADRRIFQAELTLSVTAGLKVPLSSLIDLDAAAGKASLMIIDGGYTRTCMVEVIDMDREYAIIKAIKSEKYKPAVSTILVANPQSIETGEFIGN
jgi:hypothetical protein